MTTRAGSLGLSLLAAPLNVVILEALGLKERSLVGLRRAGGSPPTTTMRRHLWTLARAGAVECRGRDGSGAVVYGLTGGGHGLLDVARDLEAWLAAAPGGGLGLDSADAGRAIRALTAAWSVGVVRALAATPLSAGDLARICRSVSIPSLEHCLSAMRLAGLTERAPGPEQPLRHMPTTWLRQATAPLAASARWERLSGLDGARPISRLDVEAAFLLAVPLVRLPHQVDGTCRLAVAVQAGGGKHAGAAITVEQGQISSCVTSIQKHADNWVSGSPSTWLDAVIDGESDSLEVGGDDRLAGALLNGLHHALFGPRLDAEAGVTDPMLS